MKTIVSLTVGICALASAALAGECPTRQVLTEPHGIVPIHTGALTEHSAYCEMPIQQMVAASTPEFWIGHKHGQENLTGQPAILISTDVVPATTKVAPKMDLP